MRIRFKKAILLTIVFLSVTSLYLIKRYEASLDSSISILGANSRTVDIAVDYSQPTIVGSPLVFGGVHAPDTAHPNAWSTLTDAGISLIRSDFFLEFCAPRNTTVENYKQNKNNVQDPANWTKHCLANIERIYSTAHKSNMKVVAVVGYTPAWLTKNRNTRDLPVDWEVYKDLVKKTYSMNRQYIDYIEVWNEPDHPNFLQLSNSSISKEDAYQLLYTNIAQAVRSVDDEANDGKRALIGGPAIACPCHMSFVEKLLSNPSNRNYIDFISIHSYEDGDSYLTEVRELQNKYGYSQLPLYISEWNKSSLADKHRDYNYTYKAVTYTAEKLIGYLNSGVAMASYFSLRQNDLNSSEKEKQAYGFYRVEGAKITPLPQQGVWKLLSDVLKLGKGQSQIFNVQASEEIPTLGFTNSEFESGIVLINNGQRFTADLTSYNIPQPLDNIDIEISRITEDSGLEASYCKERYRPKNNQINFKFDVPSFSVVSVNFIPIKNSLRDMLRILAITTSKDCIVFDDEENRN